MTEVSEPPSSPFWLKSSNEWLVTLESCPEGLGSKEAEARLKQFGLNTTRVHEPGLGQAFASQLSNPLVLILLAAAALSAGFRERTNALVITTIIVLSLGLNLLQSYRSREATRALYRKGATKASVLRDGKPVDVPATRVVPGDILVLAAGDLVAADARLIESRDLFVDQALLTGESLPAEKHASDLTGGIGLDEAINSVFGGTSIVSGVARAIVVHTGANTEIGQIAAGLARRPVLTEFERGMAAFSSLILKVTLVLVVFAFLVLALFKHNPVEAFMFAIALAVGLTPEFMPLIVAVTLGRGAIEMARHGVIVKQLQAIENFGSMDVLCSDKTGTLTAGHMVVAQAIDALGEPSQETLKAASINASHETGLESPIDIAILEASPMDPTWKKRDEIPFDFHRRRVSVIAECDGSIRLIAKGALEGILAACRLYHARGAVHPLTAEVRQSLEALNQKLGSEGMRVLAVASKEVPSKLRYGVEDEFELVFLGFLALEDSPRPDAARAIAALAADGVRTVILTGDNEWVTRSVCEAVGIPVHRVMSGAELAQVREEALMQLVTEVDVFARLTPEQKVRVVRALKHSNHVVGFLGDGINDGPSLRAADIGISVETGADVAKAAAAIILSRPGLDVLHGGVLLGRRSFTNVTKYVLMGTSSNFGNMFSMAGAAVLLPFLPMLPTQILLNNLLYDLSQLSIPGDHVDPGDAAHPRRWNIQFIRRFMVMVGPVSSLFDFLTFGILYLGFHAAPSVFQTGWFVESLLTQTLVIFVIRTRSAPWKSRPSPALIANVLAICAIAVALPFTAAAPWLGLVPLPPLLLLAIALTTLSYLSVTEAAKRYFYARESR